MIHSKYVKILLSLSLMLVLSSCTNSNNKYNETCDISKLSQTELTIQWEFMEPIFKDWDKISYIKDYYTLCDSKPKIWDIIIYSKKATSNKENKENLIPRIIKVNSESIVVLYQSKYSL